MLACSSCNNRKRNRFPLGGKAVDTAPLLGAALDPARCRVDSAELTAENPYLVNPEVDTNPMQHFRFQADGQIENLTIQGQHSIMFCNLNRPSLIVKRKKYVYDRLFNKLTKYFGRSADGRLNDTRLHHLVVDAIEDFIDYMIDDDNQYLEFAKTCWEQFDKFFIARFQPHEQVRLQAAYDEVQALLAEV